MEIGGMHSDRVVDPSGGANQSRVRAYNERLVLSLVRRHGSLPKSEIARRSGLSAQTVSVIMRSLERDGLLIRGEPQRGRVGQPSIPMSLDADGVFSIGLKIGRRSADLILVDFLGRERKALHQTYDYPMPGPVLAFATEGIRSLIQGLEEAMRKRIAGIGVAMPFELWNWAEKVGAPAGRMDAWRDFDLQAELGQAELGMRFGLPVFVENDATAACGAELVFGRGAEFSDFVYFFIGTFIGGGIVLNHAVYSGRTGNAGALGSMPVAGRGRRPGQLIDHASIYELEAMLKRQGIDPSPLWLSPGDWSSLKGADAPWIEETASAIAIAIASSCSVIDFEAVIIDGGFPPDIRERLVEATGRELDRLNLQGISRPKVLEGVIGAGARAIGGASLPLFARYLLDQNVLFKEPQHLA